MSMTTRYTKTIRTIWLDTNAQTYLPVAHELDSHELIPATTEGGKQVAEYLQWIRRNAEYRVGAHPTLLSGEYTRVYITEAQLTYILMRWNGIRYATDKWKTADV